MKQNLESLSPFELNLYLESRMIHQETNKEWLNAGRGNPNWTAPIPRAAYFLLGEFATRETMRKEKESIGTMIKAKAGQTARFETFINGKDSPGAQLLQDIWENGSHLLGMPKETWLKQMLDYSIGDNYPYPERVLTACELPIKQYLHHELFDSNTVPFDIFAVEGGTAGIVYTFKSLVNNHLLEKHDKIALMIPTFAPYMEIPELPEYGFDVEYISAELMEIDGQRSYQFPESELDRLRNDDIKAVFVVNPSNPTANAIYGDSIEQMKDIVKNDNPNLMILSDDVYGTFLKEFTSLFTAIPYNTACIYSYSKYFGATGWRIGTIALAKENIFDKRLRDLPESKKEALDERYGTLTSNPRDILCRALLGHTATDVALLKELGLHVGSVLQAWRPDGARVTCGLPCTDMALLRSWGLRWGILLQTWCSYGAGMAPEEPYVCRKLPEPYLSPGRGEMYVDQSTGTCPYYHTGTYQYHHYAIWHKDQGLGNMWADYYTDMTLLTSLGVMIYNMVHIGYFFLIL
ncbi:MAG: aspartate 4-decarboxylase [Alkalibacterium sp.]|uniref:aspartate 4-decarboxylase n=1 Tax=Alkalibacterium sp. TaxID=1872447 RepID=UPI0039704AF0